MAIKQRIGQQKDVTVGEASPTENSEVKTAPKKRVCLFCESKTMPSYTDTSALRKFVSDRAKIIPRARTGACSKHQRHITKQIKYARHLALLPFVAKV